MFTAVNLIFVLILSRWKTLSIPTPISNRLRAVDAGRVVVRIESSRGRDREACSPVGSRARCDAIAQTRVIASAIEADRRLLIGAETDCIRQISDAAGHFAAVKPPCEGGPRSMFLVLITHVSGLLKDLVVIDPEDFRLAVES